jgi:CubicO group peptidase (beta-lactamase class C family)
MKPESAKPIELNTVMWVASCTKVMTSICALQLVERGLVALDDPVYKHIPELESLKIIKSFDADTGAPVEEKHSVPMTLRHLLTHSSGLTYDAIHPTTLAWLAYHKRKPNSSGKLLERFGGPMVAEPGESWAYGPSIDFAGLLIERISGQTLEEYMRANLWEHLGINDMTFFLSSRPDLKARLADMSMRDAQGKVQYSDTPMPYQDSEGAEVQDCMGGQGVFTNAEEYIKVLKALLVADQDGKILKKETVEMMFKPQLSKGSSEALNATLQDEMVSSFVSGPKGLVGNRMR